MNILYLDFNGVLHDSMVMRNRKRGLYLAKAERSFFEWMPILDELLVPYPDLKIVLSTSWVRAVSFDTAKYDLSPGLQDRVIGSTFHHPGLSPTAFDTMSRGLPANWFAIDDDAYGWPAAHRNKLIETKPDLGLSDPAAQDAVRAMLAAL
jgi:hypothetical protein